MTAAFVAVIQNYFPSLQGPLLTSLLEWLPSASGSLCTHNCPCVCLRSSLCAQSCTLQNSFSRWPLSYRLMLQTLHTRPNTAAQGPSCSPAPGLQSWQVSSSRQQPSLKPLPLSVAPGTLGSAPEEGHKMTKVTRKGQTGMLEPQPWSKFTPRT